MSTNTNGSTVTTSAPRVPKAKRTLAPASIHPDLALADKMAKAGYHEIAQAVLRTITAPPVTAPPVTAPASTPAAIASLSIPAGHGQRLIRFTAFAAACGIAHAWSRHNHEYGTQLGQVASKQGEITFAFSRDADSAAWGEASKRVVGWLDADTRQFAALRRAFLATRAAAKP